MPTFVSYKSDDREAVGAIVQGLQAEGFDVWWDQGIPASTEWRREIALNLARADAVVVIWSNVSTDSQWVIQEAEDAEERGILIPVLIDDVRPPMGLRHRQLLDLIDWRGDRQDPRWTAFIDTVRSKVDGTPVEARVVNLAPDAGMVLRGRGPQLVLTAGLAALAITATITFGWVAFAALVLSLLLSYLILNLLLSRRRNDRAAATFVRRSLSVRWIRILANAVVWTAVLSTAAYPYARRLLFEEFSVSVYDEMRQPVQNAEVTWIVNARRQRVTLNSAGVGHIEYPIYWGPQDGAVGVRFNSYNAERPTQRERRQFPDMTLGVPSGVERVRVRHMTLKELAIEAIQQGRTPAELTNVIPTIAGTVRNKVWEETEAFLRMYTTLGRADGTYMGGRLGNRAFGSSADAQSKNSTFRWPREHHADFTADFSDNIYGCETGQLLDEKYRLIIGDDDSYVQSDLDPDAASAALLTGKGIERVRREDGTVRGQLIRRANQEWLRELLQSRPRIGTQYSTEREVVDYLRFMAARAAPEELIGAQVRLSAGDGCGFVPVSVELSMPAPELRITLVENVSEVPLPITSVVQGIHNRQRIELASPARADETTITPWAGGMLAPGTAIAIPRRLTIKREMTRDEFSAWTTSASGPPMTFRVRNVVPEPNDDHTEDYRRGAKTIALRAGQVVIAEEVKTTDADDEPFHTTPTFIIGPSVETLALRLSDIEFAMREDAGVTLAMVGGFEFGTCPLVYAAEPHSDVLDNRGPILTRAIGAHSETTDRRYLGRRVGKIEIRELEPEITNLRRARLVVRSSNGGERVFAAARAGLRWTDGRYLQLRQGESVRLQFPGYQPLPGDEAVFLEVTGFYTPLMSPYTEQSALRRRGIGTMIPRPIKR